MNAKTTAGRQGFLRSAGGFAETLHQTWVSSQSKKAALKELRTLSPAQLRDVGLYRDTGNTVRRMPA